MVQLPTKVSIHLSFSLCNFSCFCLPDEEIFIENTDLSKYLLNHLKLLQYSNLRQKNNITITTGCIGIFVGNCTKIGHMSHTVIFLTVNLRIQDRLQRGTPLVTEINCDKLSYKWKTVQTASLE